MIGRRTAGGRQVIQKTYIRLLFFAVQKPRRWAASTLSDVQAQDREGTTEREKERERDIQQGGEGVEGNPSAIDPKFGFRFSGGRNHGSAPTAFRGYKWIAKVRERFSA